MSHSDALLRVLSHLDCLALFQNRWCVYFSWVVGCSPYITVKRDQAHTLAGLCWCIYVTVTGWKSGAEHSVEHWQLQIHKGTKPYGPFWQSIFWCLLPGSTHQGYLVRLLSRMCSHFRWTATGLKWNGDRAEATSSALSCFVPHQIAIVGFACARTNWAKGETAPSFRTNQSRCENTSWQLCSPALKTERNHRFLILPGAVPTRVSSVVICQILVV